MMETASRGRLNCLLVAFGGLGLLFVLAVLPLAYGALNFERALQWQQGVAWGTVALQYMPYLLGLLSALLFVSGDRIGYAGAGLGAVFGAGYAVALPRAQTAVAESASFVPVMILAGVLAVGTLIVAVLAIRSGSAGRRSAGSVPDLEHGPEASV